MMNVKLALEWTSLLSHLIDLARFAQKIVEWWRSIFYPFMIDLGFDFPPFFLDVLGVMFSLFNISLVLVVLYHRNLFDRYNVDDSPDSRVVYLLKLIRAQFVGIAVYLSWKAISGKAPHGTIRRHLVQETPVPLHQRIAAIATFVAVIILFVGFAIWNSQTILWSLIALFVVTTFNLTVQAWESPIALHFLKKGKRRGEPSAYQSIEFYPIRWVIGFLIAIWALNVLYGFIGNRRI